jgi:putative transposase
VGIDHSTLRYQPRPADDAALRQRLRELAQERRRFGYRRLGWLLAREGHTMNSKKLYRLYREEKLTVRRRGGRKRALGTRAPMVLPLTLNQRWSLDFVSDTLSDGRRFRILAIVDDFSRECLTMVVDTSLGGVRVVRELERLALEPGTPQIIVSDNELSKKAMARNEHTTAVARRASNAGYDCAIVEKTMHRPGSLRVGAPSRVRSHRSPADAALDRRRHCG